MFNFDKLFLTSDEVLFHGIFEFSHVARPRVRFEDGERRTLEASLDPFHFAKFLCKVSNQRLEVVNSFAKRGDFDH